MKDPPPAKNGLSTALAYIAAIVAALALFVTNIKTLQEAWCNYIGLYCPVVPQNVHGDEVHVESGGTTDNKSDVCKAHQTSTCVKSSDPTKKLSPATATFEVSDRSAGTYNDGNRGPAAVADPIGTSNIGWFLQPDKQSPDEVCATVYARTSACETKVFISGRLTVEQK
ncbi:MAG: hypothetical protein JO216_04535 [Hyphomicrobiales bacterium]|nr:hypothetical protein [Hyphomicrobiales bacterium]